jgi:2-oxoglutarate dehydrogenase E2 component (dihydrolipoamide succinyltransferase)
MELKVPTLGESLTEATVLRWFKAVGDTIVADEPLVELETDKVTLEVPAPAAGTLSEIRAREGTNVEVGAVLAVIANGAAAATGSPAPVSKAPAPAADSSKPAPARKLSPAVRKLVAEHALDVVVITATGKDGRLTKGDVIAYLEGVGVPASEIVPVSDVAADAEIPDAPDSGVGEAPGVAAREVSARGEERVPMTRLRRRIAERLKEAQNTAAMLTTFNEVDMTGVIAARTRHRERFEAKHGVKLGFMSFFAKACIVALNEVPSVNAEIDDTDIVYRNYIDLGIAVGTEQGLVVPVLRDAGHKTFAEIEKEIGALGRGARDGKLSMAQLTGGTFTITNGGVYGSLLSTPILNPPQSGILGMHKIQPRPIAVDDKVEIRPMMYLALSYDHRLVDGAEAVTFLVRVKECIEDPDRILLDV